MRKFLLVTLSYTLLLGAQTRKDLVEIQNGFSTGQDYIEWTESARRYYAIGIVNGMLLSPAFDAPKGHVAWLENCVVGMNDKQIAEILFQYIHGHPARWHEGLNTLSFGAFVDACPESPLNRRRQQ
ncbi:MAG: hypothetical protein ABSG25_01245 [Bryobacteraceae bacterium]